MKLSVRITDLGGLEVGDCEDGIGLSDNFFNSTTTITSDFSRPRDFRSKITEGSLCEDSNFTKVRTVRDEGNFLKVFRNAVFLTDFTDRPITSAISVTNTVSFSRYFRPRFITLTIFPFSLSTTTFTDFKIRFPRTNCLREKMSDCYFGGFRSVFVGGFSSGVCGIFRKDRTELTRKLFSKIRKLKR